MPGRTGHAQGARRKGTSGSCGVAVIEICLLVARTMSCRPQISDADRDALEAAVNDHIRQNLPYRQHLYRRDEYARRPPRRRLGRHRTKSSRGR